VHFTAVKKYEILSMWQDRSVIFTAKRPLPGAFAAVCGKG